MCEDGDNPWPSKDILFLTVADDLIGLGTALPTELDKEARERFKEASDFLRRARVYLMRMPLTGAAPTLGEAQLSGFAHDLLSAFLRAERPDGVPDWGQVDVMVAALNGLILDQPQMHIRVAKTAEFCVKFSEYLRSQ